MRELLIKLSDAVYDFDNSNPLLNEIDDALAELAKPEPEPDYRCVLKEINEFIIDQPEGTDSLCAHTVQQKPLSEYELIELLKKHSNPLVFAREIEASHGIK